MSNSTNEMSRVLESGNSLEVVFNDDQLANKSGGGTETGEKVNTIAGTPPIFKGLNVGLGFRMKRGASKGDF